MSGAPIDLDRCRLAMKELYVEGDPCGPVRAAALADAIARIQADGAQALFAEYVGVKRYSGFGDQRYDCGYGYGPRHGSIVFSIGRRTDQAARLATLGADHVYLLEAVRDFGQVSVPDLEPLGQPQEMNLCEVLRRRDRLRAIADDLDSFFAAARVESHEVAP